MTVILTLKTVTEKNIGEVFKNSFMKLSSGQFLNSWATRHLLFFSNPTADEVKQGVGYTCSIGTYTSPARDVLGCLLDHLSFPDQETHPS